jgi:K+-transporting ATPase KdpF subunit
MSRFRQAPIPIICLIPGNSDAVQRAITPGFLRFLYTRLTSFYNIFTFFRIRWTSPKQACAGGNNGHGLSRRHRGTFACHLCAGDWVRQTGRTAMNAFYIIGAAVSAGLLVYLIVALLNAENL